MMLIYLIGVVLPFVISVYTVTMIECDENSDLSADAMMALVVIVFIVSVLSWLGFLGILAIKLAVHNSKKQKIKEEK